MGWLLACHYKKFALFLDCLNYFLVHDHKKYDAEASYSFEQYLAVYARFRSLSCMPSKYKTPSKPTLEIA